MGERTLSAYEIETAIGPDVRSGKDLPVNADREWQRNAGGAIVAMVARVSRPRHNRIGARARQVVSAPWRRHNGIPNYSAGTVRQSHGPRGARRILLVRVDVWVGHASLRSPATAGLRQREWERADGQQQKQIKCTSNEMRFDSRVNLPFHFGGVPVIY